MKPYLILLTIIIGTLLAIIVAAYVRWNIHGDNLAYMIAGIFFILYAIFYKKINRFDKSDDSNTDSKSNN